MTRKLDKEHNEKLKSIAMQNEIANRDHMNRRARSCTIGTAGGGILELCLRTEHYGTIWYQFNPVEAVEIMGQLAAASGIEMAVRPRKDFASWRSWDTNLPGSVHWMGTAPWQLNDDDRQELIESKIREIENYKSSLPQSKDSLPQSKE